MRAQTVDKTIFELYIKLKSEQKHRSKSYLKSERIQNYHIKDNPNIHIKHENKNKYSTATKIYSKLHTGGIADKCPQVECCRRGIN